MISSTRDIIVALRNSTATWWSGAIRWWEVPGWAWTLMRYWRSLEELGNRHDVARLISAARDAEQLLRECGAGAMHTEACCVSRDTDECAERLADALRQMPAAPAGEVEA